ncbi:hypothetical protein BC829DRAFT_455452 [Chytridium lagenaria]|nr:hypothetical protein BC829DRAFT_455452 [Chytridium lagenaria]
MEKAMTNQDKSRRASLDRLPLTPTSPISSSDNAFSRGRTISADTAEPFRHEQRRGASLDIRRNNEEEDRPWVMNGAMMPPLPQHQGHPQNSLAGAFYPYTPPSPPPQQQQQQQQQAYQAMQMAYQRAPVMQQQVQQRMGFVDTDDEDDDEEMIASQRRLMIMQHQQHQQQQQASMVEESAVDDVLDSYWPGEDEDEDQQEGVSSPALALVLVVVWFMIHV